MVQTLWPNDHNGSEPQFLCFRKEKSKLIKLLVSLILIHLLPSAETQKAEREASKYIIRGHISAPKFQQPPTTQRLGTEADPCISELCILKNAKLTTSMSKRVRIWVSAGLGLFGKSSVIKVPLLFRGTGGWAVMGKSGWKTSKRLICYLPIHVAMRSVPEIQCESSGESEGLNTENADWAPFYRNKETIHPDVACTELDETLVLLTWAATKNSPFSVKPVRLPISPSPFVYN